MLGVRPWEWAALTVEEADALMRWVDEYIEESKKASKGK